MNKTHPLLRRQLKKIYGADADLPQEIEDLAVVINQAYSQFDEDRIMLERSLDLSSQELSQANAQMRAVFQAFPDQMLLIDNTGKVIDAKSGNDVAFELKPEKMIGRNLAETPLQEQATLLMNAAQEVSESQKIQTVEFTRSSNGREITIEARVIPVKASESILVMRNITEVKRIEEEIFKARKLESIGVLAGGIAHDFNNLLTGILGNISLARIYEQDGQPLAEILENAEAAGLRARDLTQQFLTFSKGGAPIREAALIVDLLEESAGFSLRGSNVKCRFELAADIWQANIDRGQISQVINNLVINADQAMPDGGEIVISASNVVIEEISKNSLQSGRYIKVAIADEGVGIAARDLKKIFDPYFTTKEFGSGLGLASSYGIINKHRGSISVESTVGVGTTFCIHLPAVESGIIADDTSDELISGSGHIAVMDDEDIILKTVSMQLEKLGYKVSTAKDGQQLVDLYQQHLQQNDPLDLVILDLTVPGGLGGRKTIQLLKEVDPDVRAIVSSGYSNDPIMADYERYGFTGVVVKPFRMTMLSQEIHRVLRKTVVDS